MSGCPLFLAIKLQDIWRKFVSPRVINLVAAAGFCLFGAISASAATLDLAPYRGQVIYLDFWTSWCGPCKQSFPWLKRMQSTYGPKGFAVIAVNLDHDRARADAFLRETGGGFRVVYDPRGKLAAKYNIQGMPSAVLIGRDGRTRYSHAGFFAGEAKRYEAQLSELVNEK